MFLLHNNGKPLSTYASIRVYVFKIHLKLFIIDIYLQQYNWYVVMFDSFGVFFSKVLNLV